MKDDRRTWVREAIRRIEADFQRCSDTHLIPVSLPGFPGIDLYLKDDACALAVDRVAAADGEVVGGYGYD